MWENISAECHSFTIKGHEMLALSCATTGFAVQLCSSGRTVDNLFGIPVQGNPTDLLKLKAHIIRNSQKADLLRVASLFVWDELVSSRKMNFQAVSDLMQ